MTQRGWSSPRSLGSLRPLRSLGRPRHQSLPATDLLCGWAESHPHALRENTGDEVGFHGRACTPERPPRQPPAPPNAATLPPAALSSCTQNASHRRPRLPGCPGPPRAWVPGSCLTGATVSKGAAVSCDPCAPRGGPTSGLCGLGTGCAAQRVGRKTPILLGPPRVPTAAHLLRGSWAQPRRKASKGYPGMKARPAAQILTANTGLARGLGGGRADPRGECG